MARFCPNCGAGLADAAKFCASCGAQVPGTALPQAPPYIPAPTMPKKKSRTPLIIAGLAGLVVLIVIIAIASNSGSSGNGISATRPATPTGTSTADDPIQTSSDAGLLGARWRANIELSGAGFICLYFNANGEFTQEVRFVLSSTVFSWEESYKGTYSASDGTLALTYTSAEHHDYGKGWEAIEPPANRTLAYAYSAGPLGQEYLDISDGGFPPFDEPVAPRGAEYGGMGITRFVRADFDGPVWDR